MNNSDLSSIREQLLAFQSGSDTEDESTPTTWENSRSPSLPFPHGSSSTTIPPHQAEMAQALRQRSPQPTRQPTPEEVAATASPIPTNINNCLRRLQEEAEKINDLYRQQELAIQKFQRTAKGLDFILLRQGDSNGLKSEQFCELRSAALTTVMQDNSGRYILTAVDIDLNIDEYQAFQDAAGVRAFRKSRKKSAGGLKSVRGRIEAHMGALEGVWHSLTTTLEERTQITPLDVLVWCGGGVIGRLALDLALAAIPGLWQWVVAVTIAAVALGLYRLMFSGRPDLGFIVRLFLAFLGLAIGGQI